MSGQFDGMRYFDHVPRKLKKGRVLVHNHVAHTKDVPPGLNGFRCWTQNYTRSVVPCQCGWASVPHYRVRALGSGKSYSRKQLEARLGRKQLFVDFSHPVG